MYQAVMRKGLFWHYLEHRDIKAIAKEEKSPPCSKLYIPDKKTLLFEVSYYKNRINFEVFHALTDGTGAMYFLQELVQDYLLLAHPEVQLPRILQLDETVSRSHEEDSFSQYYSSDLPGKREKKPGAIQLKGETQIGDDMDIPEVVLPGKDTLAKAREKGVSVTVLLAAMLLCAI